MNLRSLAALVRRDVRLFFADRRTVLITLALPVILASIMAVIFGGGGHRQAARIAVLVSDQDESSVSRDITERMRKDPGLEVSLASPEEAREAVRRGKAAAAILLPAGFGEAVGLAFFGGSTNPQLPLLVDPSRTAESSMVRGMAIQHIMGAVSHTVFSPDTARAQADMGLRAISVAPNMDAQDKEALRHILEGIRDYYGRPAEAGAARPRDSLRGPRVPFDLQEEPVTAASGVTYDAHAHSFAGMGVQFVLFLALESGMALLAERRRGLWDRLRSAPLSRGTVLASRAASATLLSLLVLVVVFTFGFIFFKVRIQGSFVGFLAVLVATAIMSSTFGLLLAALGRTPEATRGLSIFAVLMMTMLGGAWVPAFLFPEWMQRATQAAPTRWAMDGLDAMTWRGLELTAALVPSAVLLGFAAVFATIAVLRFRWD